MIARKIISAAMANQRCPRRSLTELTSEQDEEHAKGRRRRPPSRRRSVSPASTSPAPHRDEQDRQHPGDPTAGLNAADLRGRAARRGWKRQRGRDARYRGTSRMRSCRRYRGANAWEASVGQRWGNADGQRRKAAARPPTGPGPPVRLPRQPAGGWQRHQAGELPELAADERGRRHQGAPERGRAQAAIRGEQGQGG